MSKDEHNQQDFDRLFQQKLAGHSVAPPANMWEKINANTEANKNRKGILWIIINDTSMMVVLAAIMLFALMGSDAMQSNAAVTETGTETRSEQASFPIGTSDSGNRSEVESSAQQIQEVETALSVSEIAEPEPPSTSPSEGQSSSVASNAMTLGGHLSSGGKAETQTANTNKKLEESPTPSSDLSANDDTRNQEPLEKSASNDLSATSPEQKQESIGTGSEGASAPSFRLSQIPVIPPFLSNILNEDSLNITPVEGLPKELTGTPDHEVYGGVHANFNLPLIFNQNTYGAFNGKELAYKPTFGMASGVRVGYTFKRQYGFETGFIFYSRQGQEYEDKLNGQVAKRQVNLQYFHVPLVLRYKFKIKNQKRFESPWVINLGADVGILRSARITYSGNEYPLGTIANPEANDKDYFRPIDASVVLGVEKEFYFTKWLMLSVGMRTTFSGDINDKDHPVENDGNYDKSHNFTIGFTLGLNYYLRR